MKRILFHVCCGPCSIYPLKKMLEGEFIVHGFFYNPNIHPFEEFQKRVSAVKTLAEFMKIDMVFSHDYDPIPYLESLPPSPEINKNRCLYCYALRLEKTALLAKEKGFDFFSTTLLQSVRQDHELIKQTGLDIEKKHGINFYYEDYRRGWKEAIEGSKRLALYRQKYCGCIFSKMERGL